MKGGSAWLDGIIKVSFNLQQYGSASKLIKFSRNREGFKKFLAIVIPPLLVFLTARIFLWIAAFSINMDFSNPEILSKRDSAHYLSIAERGYEYFSCSQLPGFDPNDWCGNTGWLPGYPYIISLFIRFGLSPILGGVILSALFHLLTLILLWTGFLRKDFGNIICLIFAGFFPGQIYYHAVFPISTFSFFAFLSFYLLLKERWGWAGLAGSMAAFTYSSGVLLSLVMFIWVLLTYRRIPWQSLFYRLSLPAFLTALGFLMVLVLHKFTVGAWNAFFKVHAKYDHGIYNPMSTLLIKIKPLFNNDWQLWCDAPAFQTLFISLFILLIVVKTLMHKHKATSADLLILIYITICWLFPLILGKEMSLYRSEALLIPSVLLSRFLPLKLQVFVTAVSALIAFPMAILFYKGILV